MGVKKDGTPVLETGLAANKTLQDAVLADEGFRGAVTSTLASPEAVAADAGLQTAVKML
ncbi:MAG: hypothetical protein ACEY3A_02535 [Wolbachia sp.]